MTRYLGIIEEEPSKAIGVWFPDLPSCFSGGDTLHEAVAHAPVALALYAKPRRRTLPRRLRAL